MIRESRADFGGVGTRGLSVARRWVTPDNPSEAVPLILRHVDRAGVDAGL